MPLYCYYDPETGEPVDLFLGLDEMLEMSDDNSGITHEGRYLKRDYPRETNGWVNTAWSTPLKSDALGVGLDQIDDAIAHSREIGVPTDFDRKTGEAIFRSRGHRKRYCEATGYVDRDGGYGDPTQSKEEQYQGRSYGSEPVSPDDYNLEGLM